VKRMTAAEGNASAKYELVDEKTMLEKAKQALRQNRTGQKKLPAAFSAVADNRTARTELLSASPKFDAEHKSSKVTTTHQHRPPPEPDPYQAIVAHLQRSKEYRASPAEAAIRKSQMQTFMAQEKHPPRPLQENPMPSHNPYAATSNYGVDPGQYRKSIAVQQYENLHQHHIPASTVPIQPGRFTSADVAGDDSDFIGIFLDEQMNQGLQSRLGLERKEASLPQSREPHEYYSASHNAPIANSIPDSQMKELEKIFAGTSRNKPYVRSGFRSLHDASSREQRKSNADSDFLMDCMEDMSFLSISIGNISDMSAMGPPRLWHKRSVGGTIIETAGEKYSSMDLQGAAESSKRESTIGGYIYENVQHDHGLGGGNPLFTPYARGEPGNFRASLDEASGNHISDSRMKALESIFARTSRKNMPNGYSDSMPHHHATSTREQSKRYGSSVDSLLGIGSLDDDLSSIGDMSELSLLGASLYSGQNSRATRRVW